MDFGGSAVFAEILSRPRAGSVAESALNDKDLMEPIYLAGMYLHVALDHYLTVQSMFIPAEAPQGASAPTLREEARRGPTAESRLAGGA